MEGGVALGRKRRDGAWNMLAAVMEEGEEWKDKEKTTEQLQGAKCGIVGGFEILGE